MVMLLPLCAPCSVSYLGLLVQVSLATQVPCSLACGSCSAPVQHFKAAVLDVRLLLIFAVGKVFGVGHCWMCVALCSSLTLLMSWKEMRLCCGALWPVRSQVIPCRSCWAPDGDGHLFWECPYPPLVENRENPEFHDIMRMDKGHWPRCLLWHGSLPMLSGVNGASPWAASASEGAHYLVEVAAWSVFFWTGR